MTVNSFKNILIPVNFSESSDHAVSTGIEMCKRHQTSLHLLFVAEAHNPAIPAGKNAGVFEMALAARVALQDDLEAQARKIAVEHSIDCYFHTAEGVFHLAVAEVARDFHCELVILQKSRSRGMFDLIKKHSIYRILKHAECPVLSVPAERPVLRFKKVLFPVRPLMSALQKLEVARSIIRKNNAKVLMFSAVSKSKVDEELPLVRELTSKACSQLEVNEVDIEREQTVVNDVAREVISKASEKKADLIIITATIKRGLKAFFYRNYTERVIALSQVPVLSVKTEGDFKVKS